MTLRFSLRPDSLVQLSATSEGKPLQHFPCFGHVQSPTHDVRPVGPPAHSVLSTHSRRWVQQVLNIGATPTTLADSVPYYAYMRPLGEEPAGKGHGLFLKPQDTQLPSPSLLLILLITTHDTFASTLHTHTCSHHLVCHNCMYHRIPCGPGRAGCRFHIPKEIAELVSTAVSRHLTEKTKREPTYGPRTRIVPQTTVARGGQRVLRRVCTSNCFKFFQ